MYLCFSDTYLYNSSASCSKTDIEPISYVHLSFTGSQPILDAVSNTREREHLDLREPGYKGEGEECNVVLCMSMI